MTWQIRKDSVRNQLLDTFIRCSAKGWDGYGALPISNRAHSEAKTFLEALPTWIPLPEIVPEPDGGIGLEWFGGSHRVFVVSISGDNTITYAGLIGMGNKIHGIKVFNDSIPTIIIDSINEIFPL